jgi:hypothetical protein
MTKEEAIQIIKVIYTADCFCCFQDLFRRFRTVFPEVSWKEALLESNYYLELQNPEKFWEESTL